MSFEQTIKSKLQMIVNQSTLSAFKIPAGISRIAVRGLSASNFASSQRLKAMAALRANTIQSTTSMKVRHQGAGQPVSHILQTSVPAPVRS